MRGKSTRTLRHKFSNTCASTERLSVRILFGDADVHRLRNLYALLVDLAAAFVGRNGYIGEKRLVPVRLLALARTKGSPQPFGFKLSLSPLTAALPVDTHKPARAKRL